MGQFGSISPCATAIWVNFLQNELMVEIYFKSLVRAIGEVLRMEFGLTSCISTAFFSLKNVDRYDHYAACCVPLSG